MIVVDSSVWIDYFNGRPSAETDILDGLLGSELLAIGDVILVETLQGFRSDADFRMARRLLTSMPILPMLTPDRAVRCAERYRALRKRGTTVRKTIDAIIASYCIDEGVYLLYADRDFTPFVEHFGLKTPSLR